MPPAQRPGVAILVFLDEDVLYWMRLVTDVVRLDSHLGTGHHHSSIPLIEFWEIRIYEVKVQAIPAEGCGPPACA